MQTTTAVKSSPTRLRTAAQLWALFVVAALLLGAAISSLVELVQQPDQQYANLSSPAWDPAEILDPVDYVHGVGKTVALPGGMAAREVTPPGHLTLTFRDASHRGSLATVRATLASSAGLASAPLTATLYVNEAIAGVFGVDAVPRTFTAKINTAEHPNPYLAPANVQVDLALDPPSEGLLVSDISLETHRSAGEVLLNALALGLALALVALVSRWRLSLRWAAVYTGGAALMLAAMQATYIPRGIPVPVELALGGAAWLLGALLAPAHRPAWGLAFAGLGVWLVLAGRLLGEWQMDDAYISYRYAWNLVHGHGLVYNPGEVVEGYTNFLWTLVAAVAISLGWHPAAMALAGTIASALGIVLLTWLLARRLSGGRNPWPFVAAGLVAIDSAVVSYGARGSGMEAAPFGALVLLAAALLWTEQARYAVWLRAAGGLALALASLMRPEGLMVAALFIGVRALQDRAEKKAALRLLAPALGAFLVIIVPYELWRVLFYGYPFPNTFYAKTGATAALIERGIAHVSYFVGDSWLIVVLGVAGIVYATVAKRARGGLPGALALLVAAYVAYIVWAGGDHFPGWRFFVPLVGPLALLSVEAARVGLAWLSQMRWAGLAAGVGLLAVVGVYAMHMAGLLAPGAWLSERTKLHDIYVDRWGAAGLWLRENTPPDATVAAKGAGAIAYYADRTAIDLYGLNDLHIGHLTVATMGQGNPGHDKEDPAYVLHERKPNYILDEWLSSFKPVLSDLKAAYAQEAHANPLGPETVWWRRQEGR